MSFYLMMMVSGCSHDPKVPDVSSTSPHATLSPDARANAENFSYEYEEDLRAKRWKLKVEPIFGKLWPKPPLLAALTSRATSEPKKAVREKSNDPIDYLNNVHACYKSYRKQWGKDTEGTRGILKSLNELKNGSQASSCWTAKEKEEIDQLKKNINDDLKALQILFESHKIKIQKTKKHKIKNYKTRIHKMTQLEKALTKLGRHYQDVQEKLSFCRLKNSISPHATESPSNDVMNHFFVKNLIGKNEVDQFFLESRPFFIKNISEHLKKNKYIASNAQADPCGSITKDVYHPDEDDRALVFPDMDTSKLDEIIKRAAIASELTSLSLEEFIVKFKNIIENPEINSFYFRRGTRTDGSFYRFTKKESDTYQFQIYNSNKSIGDNSYHQARTFEVSKKALTSENFLKSLHGSAILTEKEILILEGRQTTKKLQPEDFLDLPMISNGSNYAFPYRHASYLENQALTKHLDFFTKSEILDKYFNLDQNRFSDYDIDAKLAKKYLAFYSEEIAKNISTNFAWKERYLDRGMAHESSLRIAKYRRILDDAHRIREESRPKIAPLNFQNLETTNNGGNFKEISHLDEFKLIEKNTSYLSNDYSSALTSLGLEDWNPTDSDSLFEGLHRFWRILAPKYYPSHKKKSYEVGRFLVEIPEIIKKIPLEEDFLRKLSADDLEELLAYLNELGQLHVFALLEGDLKNCSDTCSFAYKTCDNLSKYEHKNRANAGLSSISILTQIRILTLADQIMQIYGKKDGKESFQEFPSLYTSALSWLVLDKGRDDEDTRMKNRWTSYWNIEPYWMDSFREISEYWHKQKERINQPIFEWERYPMCADNKYFTQYKTFKLPKNTAHTFPLFDRSASAMHRYIFKDKKNDDFNLHWSYNFSSSKEEKLFWRDISWAAKFLGKDLTKASDIGYVINSLSYHIWDGSYAIRHNQKKINNILPKVFFEARDISFLTHWMLLGSFSSKTLKLGAKFLLREDSYFQGDHSNRISKIFDFGLKDLDQTDLKSRSNSKKELNCYYNCYLIFDHPYKLIETENKDDLLKMNKTENKDDPLENLYTGNPSLSLDLNGEHARIGPWLEKIECMENCPSSDNYFKMNLPYYRRMSSAEILSDMEYMIPLRKDLPKNTQIFIDNLEMQRDFLDLGSPIVTLGYFMDNPDLLQEKSWQLLFKRLISQPVLLLEELQKTFVLLETFSNFMWSNFEERLEKNDYLTAAFFARMHQLLEQLVTVSKKQLSLPKERRAADAFYKILCCLSAFSDSEYSDMKNILYRDVMKTFSFKDFKSLTWKDLSLFVAAAIYRDNHPITDIHNFESTEEYATSGIYMLNREGLIQAVKDLNLKDRDLFMESIFKFSEKKISISNYQWTQEEPKLWKYKEMKKDPLWIGTKKNDQDAYNLKVDLSIPKIFVVDKNGSIQSEEKENKKRLPESISNNPLFKEWFPQNPKEANCIGENSYEIIDAEGGATRINITLQPNADITIKIQRKWGNRWYQLMDDNTVNQWSEENDRSVMPGYSNWISVGEKEKTYSPEAYNKDNESDEYEDKDRDGGESENKWKSWDRLKDGREILAFDLKDKHLYAVSRSTIVQKVKYDDHGKAIIDGTTLFKLKDEDTLKVFYRIEHPRFVWIWKHHEHGFQEVELPRFGVSFQLKDKKDNQGKHFVSSELEGYALREDQNLPNNSEPWGDFDHFMVLEKENKIRIAVPRMNFESPKYNLYWFSRSHEEQAERPEIIHKYGKGSQKLLVWPINDGHIHPPEVEDRMYLALIHLYGHSYERARELIYGSRSNEGDFRKFPNREYISGAREVLEWIFSLNNNDDDPRSLALQLGAGLLIMENDLSYHQNSNFIDSEFKKLDSKYMSYLNLKSKIVLRFFPEDLEQLLLQKKASLLKMDKKNSDSIKFILQEGFTHSQNNACQDPMLHSDISTTYGLNWVPRTHSIPHHFVYKYNREESKDDYYKNYNYFENYKDSDFDLQKNPVISVGTLNQFFETGDSNGTEKAEIRSIKNELNEVFSAKPQLTSSLDTPDYKSFIEQKLKDYKDLINKNASETEDPSKSDLEKGNNGKIKNKDELKEYCNILKTKFNRVKNINQKLREEIINEVQSLPDGTWKHVRETIFRESRVEALPNLKEVLQAYANRSMEKVFELNPGLTQERGKKLLEHTTSYLITATYTFRLEEVIEALDQLLKIEPTTEDIEKFHQSATLLRSYDIAQHPDYLVFEYWNRILMRQEQIENLKHMTGEKTIFLEMIMGSGKTSVLLPLASHANANPEKQLSMVVLPEALVASMSKQLTDQLDLVYGQGVDRLTIQRKHKYDLDKIQYLYSRLRKDLNQGKVLVTSNSSIQSLFLIFIESLYDFQKLSEEEEKVRVQMIAAFQDIFILLKEHSYVLIDEVDSILDIMASHRFSIGISGNLENSLINATTGLYRILAENGKIHDQIKIPFMKNQNPDAKPYSRNAYDNEVKNLLIENFCNLENPNDFFNEKESIDFFNKIDRERLRKYFDSKSLEENQNYIKQLPTNELKDVISIVFTQIHQILPLTLEKTYLVHYGLCPKESEGICDPLVGIPYHAGVPMVNSRFGTDLEALNYTIQSHLESPNVYDMFELEVNQLKRKFNTAKTQKIKNNIVIHFKNYFKNYVPNFLESQINTILPETIKKVSSDISKDPHRIIQLAKKHAATKVKVFPNQLFTNAYIYKILFKKIQGMSGTLWNYESFPKFDENQQKISSDSLVHTLTALWKSKETQNVRVVKAPVPGEELENVLKKIQGSESQSAPNPQSIIDEGGFLKGRDNREVVQAILKNANNGSNSKISQMIFYDAQNYMQIMETQGKHQKIRPYVMRETDRMKTGSFWDMSHTTGSDTKVHPKTVALLTQSKSSILRDLLQSAWRLRELDRGQSVTLVVSEDDVKIMSDLLIKVYGQSEKIDPENSIVDFKKILLYLATNEAMKSAEVNYRSIKGAQRARVIEDIYSTLVSPTAFREEQANFFNAFEQVKGFFSNPRGQHPYERYGIPMVQKNTLELLKNGASQILEGPQSAFFHFEQLIDDCIKTVTSREEQIQNTVITAATEYEEPEQEMEIEAEEEEEQEEEAEEETEEVEEEETELKQDQKMEIVPPKGNYRKLSVPLDKKMLCEGTLLDQPTTEEQIIREERPIKKDPDDISKLNPLISLQDILKIGNLNDCDQLFDPRIHGSLNLFPVFQSKDEGPQLFDPFGWYQGTINFILISLNSDRSIHSSVMITRDEALYDLGEWLLEDSKQRHTEGKERSLLIYHIAMRQFIRASANFLQNYRYEEQASFENSSDGGYLEQKDSEPWPVKEQHFFGKETMKAFTELQNSEDFLNLLVQVKFLSGRTFFNKKEKLALKSWIRNSDRRTRLAKFFSSKILEFKKYTRENNFTDSVLDEILRGIQ